MSGMGGGGGGGPDFFQHEDRERVWEKEVLIKNIELDRHC